MDSSLLPPDAGRPGADAYAFLGLLIVCTLLPDVDVVGFFLGVRYSTALGHRGFSHSLLSPFSLLFWSR